MNQREIKFRIWIEDNKTFDYLDFTQLNSDKNQGATCVMPKQELQQFTGLKDKNGKEIFEGDILGKGEEKYEVNFQDGAFVIHTRHYGVKCLNEFAHLEVIGNIYENPELLKTN